MRVSVLLPVYSGESPLFLRQALDSIASQSLVPYEVVVVADGPLTSGLDLCLEEYARASPCEVRVVRFLRNRGLGAVLADGVRVCRGEIVIRCDSDDINVKERFQMQFEEFVADSSLAVYGGQVCEFEASTQSPTGLRQVPCNADDVRAWSDWRNPVNHMTAAFRRQCILDCGNYRPMRGYEDYYLWKRVLGAGSVIRNSADTLVQARAGRAMISRRRGVRMLTAELVFQGALWREGLISRRVCARNVLVRGMLRLLPRDLVSYVYARYARSKVPVAGG